MYENRKLISSAFVGFFIGIIVLIIFPNPYSRTTEIKTVEKPVLPVPPKPKCNVRPIDSKQARILTDTALYHKWNIELDSIYCEINKAVKNGDDEITITGKINSRNKSILSKKGFKIFEHLEYIHYQHELPKPQFDVSWTRE